MNDKIKGLVEQAILDVDIVYEDNILNEELTKMYIPNCFAEKFAELIVKECMILCKTAVGNRDYNTGRMHCYDNIKKHFGVEE